MQLSTPFHDSKHRYKIWNINEPSRLVDTSSLKNSNVIFISRSNNLILPLSSLFRTINIKMKYETSTYRVDSMISKVTNVFFFSISNNLTFNFPPHLRRVNINMNYEASTYPVEWLDCTVFNICWQNIPYNNLTQHFV